VFAYEEPAHGISVQLAAATEYNGYDSSMSRAFHGLSGSIGWHRDIGTGGAFVANLIGASRAPALEELFNYGPHLGNLLFEVGNDALEMERTIGFAASLRGRNGRASGEVSAYVYSIDKFVYLDVTDD
jgi:iron complex outermembrane receptor protein